MSRSAFPLAVAWLFFSTALAIADGPKDNLPNQVRAVPPVGLEVTGDDRAALDDGLERLDRAIDELSNNPSSLTRSLLPDVEIFARAVRQGLEYRELFAPRDIASAKQLLAEGLSRAESLADGKSPWVDQKGLVVRGYRSKIDGTVQPYGLVIPDSYTGEGKSRYRLDLWFHGRGERSSETVFIAERMTKVGRFAPRDTIVLHPYGRYSNAFKFAGEVDVLEALAHAKQHYRIDDDRIAVRGFSMGGAGCWQMAVHYPDLFFAANPGAGFSETPEFLKSFQQETLTPTWYERKLWRMYDCPGYAVNLYQLPTVAYSGELDIQKQAADVMESALALEGIRLMHVIGPDTKHTIDPASMATIEAKLDQLAEVGRQRLPREINFATYTLKYNRCHWLTVTELGKHWEQATVQARLERTGNRMKIAVHNVTGFKIDIPAGRSPFVANARVMVELNFESPVDSDTEQTFFETELPASDGSYNFECYFNGTAWQIGPRPTDGLRKRKDLQGPIDNAFMDSFILVRPTGKPNHAAVSQWAEAELDRMIREWRRQFRGDAIIRRDDEITEQDIAGSNLILFGDPASNKVIGKLVDRLPLTWTADSLIVGQQKLDAKHHAPIMVYPNPENPQRYVVLNSGFTYREYAYLNNARQVPKLPDWALIDVRTPADTLWPGRVVEAGFFDEAWKLK